MIDLADLEAKALAALGGSNECNLVERLRLQAEIGLIDAMNVPGHVAASYAAAANEIERLTAERDAALAKVAEYEQALGKLHGDSLDAIMEVTGEGEKFASYNLSKSKMRDWFLRRISALIARPEAKP